MDHDCQCEALRLARIARDRERRLRARRAVEARNKEDMMLFRKRVAQPLQPTSTPEGGTNNYILRNAEGILFYKPRRSELKRNPLTRYTAVEIEIAALEATKIHPLNDVKVVNAIRQPFPVEMVQDVSLPLEGFEINTLPAAGDIFIRQVESVCAALNSFGATVINLTDPSKWIRPCSVHVHVDARDMTYPDLARLILLYEYVEPHLFSMLPGYRRRSHFCIPCGSVYAEAIRHPEYFIPGGDSNKVKSKPSGSDLTRHAIIQVAYGNRRPSRRDKRACPLATRYRSLNLHAFFYRGTLEFRHMYGTTDANEIILWAMLMGGIVDSAVKLSDKNLKSLLKDNREEVLLRLCPTDEVRGFYHSQVRRFSGPQLMAESPRLGDIPKAHLKFYANGDVMVRPQEDELDAPQTRVTLPASAFRLRMPGNLQGSLRGYTIEGEENT